MTELVTYEVVRGVAVLTLDNPPVNALSTALRQALATALRRAEADPEARAVLILGQDRGFSAGADVTEFGGTHAAPTLPELCNQIEALAKPVVAGLHGTVLGGGMAIALACHYRVAEARARFGFPEIDLGLMPAAGCTQRAPRLVGAGPVLDLMLSGKAIRADAPGAAGWCDLLVDVDLRGAALGFAEQGLAVRPVRARDEGLRDRAAWGAALDQHRAAIADRPGQAAAEILRCVEAAELLPFDVGLEFEQAAFDALERSERSRALRHVFLAERRAARMPESAEGTVRGIDRIGVIGSSALAVWLASRALVLGYEVVLVAQDRAGVVQGLERVRLLLDREVTMGVLTPERRAGAEALLAGRADLVALADADLVIEAAQDGAEAQRQVFAQLDAITRQGAVMVAASTNADVEALAAETGCAEDVVGLHLPAPVLGGALAEIVVGARTGPDAVVTLAQVMRRFGRRTVRGRIVTPMTEALARASEAMVIAGASPYRVDAALRGWGMARGPFQQADLRGLSGNGGLTAALIAAGRAGRAAGRGWYDHDTDGRRMRPAPDLAPIIARYRADAGVVAREFDAETIRLRALAALANEGARLLARGVALRASDIDAAMVHGGGFPRARGGPMMAADLRGLVTVRNALRDMEEVPAPLFDTLIKNGQALAAVSAEADADDDGHQADHR